MPVVLAALPELVVALVLVLLIWAARSLFGGMLSSLASRIPFLGSVVATAIDGIVSDCVTFAELRRLSICVQAFDCVPRRG